MNHQYGKWPESSWTSKEIDWREAKRITAGIDAGTTSTEAAVLCDGELFGYAIIRTGASFEKAADMAMQKAFGDSGMTLKDISSLLATGFAKKSVTCAAKTMDEVHCHAKGARFIYGPEVHTVVDLGAQTIKTIRLYDWDRVWDVMMNDKCATGMGRNIETVCNLLRVPITQIGESSLDVESEPEPVSTTCGTYAQTETLGLFRPPFREEPLTENQIYASHLFAVAWRILGVIGKIAPLDIGEIKLYEKVCFTGGLAKNVGITKRLERELRITAAQGKHDPMLAGAIGAALLA